MIRKICTLNIICLIFIIGNKCFAQQISTDIAYVNGAFVTTVTTNANASWEHVGKTIDKFITQYKTDSKALFDWALIGVDLQGEKDGFMIFHVKSHQLKNNIVKGMMDMTLIMLGKTFTDVNYNVSLTKTKETLNEVEIFYNMYDCEEVMQSANATVKVVNLGDNKIMLSLIIEVKLKKVYDLLVTKKMYSKNMNRRYIRFVENLVKDFE